jgi:hypothetical protein
MVDPVPVKQNGCTPAFKQINLRYTAVRANVSPRMKAQSFSVTMMYRGSKCTEWTNPLIRLKQYIYEKHSYAMFWLKDYIYIRY